MSKNAQLADALICRDQRSIARADHVLFADPER
jgi:hypothetical protein